LRRKSKKLTYLFWGITFLGFTVGLGWHLSGKYFPQEASQHPDPFFDGSAELVGVVEEREASPEEKRPLPEISPEELSFRERTNRVLEDFPKKEILKDSGRDLHKPPPELVDASTELGAIEDLLDKNPELTKEGLRFYRKCALQEALLSSLRALCLHNLKQRAERAGLTKKINWKQFPDKLHRIADRLK